MDVRLAKHIYAERMKRHKESLCETALVAIREGVSCMKEYVSIGYSYEYEAELVKRFLEERGFHVGQFFDPNPVLKISGWTQEDKK